MTGERQDALIDAIKAEPDKLAEIAERFEVGLSLVQLYARRVQRG